MEVPEFKITLSHKQKSSERIIVNSAKDIAELCRKTFSADTIEWIESFVVIALNRGNKVLGFFKVSSGGTAGTVADPRVILQFALLSNASHIILCHNHPSGNPRPSRQDEALTEKIKVACSYFDVKIIDHVILTDEAYYSFADEGIL